MKKTFYKKLSNMERAAVSELLCSDAAGSLLRVRKGDKKPDSSTPIFAVKDSQTSLF